MLHLHDAPVGNCNNGTVFKFLPHCLLDQGICLYIHVCGSLIQNQDLQQTHTHQGFEFRLNSKPCVRHARHGQPDCCMLSHELATEEEEEGEEGGDEEQKEEEDEARHSPNALENMWATHY